MCRFSNLYYEAIERRNESPFKEWIKILPPNRMVPLDLYDRRDDFHKVADVVLDNDTRPDGITMQRQTVIKFETTISADDWKKQDEWLYLFVVDGNIVKIGGTRDGLKNRCGSYLCGHHIPERDKNSTMSMTNAFIYQTLDFYLELGFKVEIFGYKLDEKYVDAKIMDDIYKIRAQTYHKFESKYIQCFAEMYGFQPFLCDNSDPEYKKKEARPVCKCVCKNGKPCRSKSKEEFGDFCKKHAPKDSP
tara:strand:+ start:13 stop:753 length:741 start_codon:yes stop_codon:yes gene_type:complete